MPKKLAASVDPATTVPKVVELVKKATRITLLTGAGASVASGIPDFRSPGGMYDTLKPELLTASAADQQLMKRDPTGVVQKDVFMRNQFPYHEVRRPFIVGTADRQWKPTLAQMFVRLLHDHGQLQRLYTQNIDGLDFDVGVPHDKIVPVHGSLRQTTCESCHKDPYNGDFAAYVKEVKTKIKDIYKVDPKAPAESSNINCKLCGKPTVKPSTVLYGGAMPTAFFEMQGDDYERTSGPEAGSKGTDLMFVIGSSLTVHPAAGLPDTLARKCPRVLVNRDAAGHFDYKTRDVWMQGECDEVLLELIVQLGWLKDLAALQDQLCEASAHKVAEAIAAADASGATTAGGDDAAPQSSVDHVAGLIRDGKAKRITLLTGAGASVASGIPDFRSPGGMYDTLKPELLTASAEDQQLMKRDPTGVVQKEVFMRNQFPYHEVRRPFIIGTAERQWKPTITQMFIRLLQDNGLLMRLYTQNIDGLDFDVGIPVDTNNVGKSKIVPVHGSLRQTTCESCGRDPYDGDYDCYVHDVKTKIKDIYGVDPEAPKESRNIRCRKCDEPTVKPSTVLYGSALPAAFFECQSMDFENADPTKNSDLLFVVGSSLTVYPAAGLPHAAPADCTRVLVNNESAGSFDFESKRRDHWLQGECDDQLLQLIVKIGWLDQLAALKGQLCDKSRVRVEAAVAATTTAGAAPIAGGGKVDPHDLL